MRIMDTGPVWTSMVEADGHVKLWKGRKVIWEGSYEAFCAECGVDFEQPPRETVKAIHAKAEKLGLA